MHSQVPLLWQACAKAVDQVQREARLTQINATLNATKEKKKAKMKSGSRENVVTQQPKAMEAQTILEPRLRRSTRTTTTQGYSAPEYIDLEQVNNDNDSFAPPGSDDEGSMMEFNPDPLKKQGKGKEKKSSTVPPYSLHPDDPATFLKLAVFLNIFLAESVKEEKLQEADRLVRVYCKDLIRVSISALPLPC